MPGLVASVAVALLSACPSWAYGAPGSGSATILPVADVIAGSPGTWTIVYTADDSFSVGGIVEVAIPSGWTAPQDSVPAAAGYVTVGTDQPGGNPVLSIGSQVVAITLDSLGVGRTVALVYGDTAGGAHPGAVATAQTLAQSGVEFLVKSDPAGVTATAIATSPAVDVVPAAISRLVFVTAPFTFPTAGEAGPLRVQAQDQFGNPNPVPSNQQIVFASTSVGGTFSERGGGSFTPVTSITMSAGNDTVSLFYRDTASGTPTLTASANGQSWTEAVQQQTVTGMRHVPSGLYPTIQAAIDSATVGDTVLVAPGTYSGPGNQDLDFNGKDVVLLSEETAVATTIACSGTSRAMLFASGETSASVVDGFTFTGGGALVAGSLLNISSAPVFKNCVVTGSSVVANGSVIEITGGPTFLSCAITHNMFVSSSDIAIVRVSALSNAVFQDCRIDDNGGGVSAFQEQIFTRISADGHVDKFSAVFTDGGFHTDIAGGTFANCTFSSNLDVPAVRATGGTFNNCTFSNNFGSGSIFVPTGSPTFVDCRMDSSSAYPAPVYVEDGSPVFVNCDLTYNSGFSGGALWAGGGGTPEFINCRFENNSSADCGAMDVHTDALFTDCEFRDNSTSTSGGGLCVFDGDFTLDGCTIDGNSADGAGGIRIWNAGSVALNQCSITNNIATFGAGGVSVGGASPDSVSLVHCVIEGNNSSRAGGIAVSSGAVSLSNCVVRGNSAAGVVSSGQGGGIWIDDPAPGTSLTGCVVTGNMSFDEGGGVYLSGSGEVLLIGCTIAGNESDGAGGGGLYIGGGSEATRAVLVESIVWGNAASGPGDEIYVDVEDSVSFTTSIMDTAGVSGPGAIRYLTENIFWDPLFCAPLPPAAAPTMLGDYTIASNSPATALNSPSSTRIGAGNVGCDYGNITSIADVGNDQGRQVQIQWARAQWDGVSALDPILQYSVWRLIPPGSAAGRRPGKPPADFMVLSPPGDWDFVETIPASAQDSYSALVPTVCDSTISNGQCYSSFFVRAHTATPVVVFDCAPDSGYSIDNLVPAPPANFAVAYNTGGGNTLSWDPSPEPDVQFYRVYRSTDPDFTPTPGELVHQTSVTDWQDAGASTGVYYKITAVDVAGNEGDDSAPGTVTAVSGRPIPTRFVLLGNRPNPFNPTTTVVFELPEASDVSLRIFDVSGRLIRTLVRQPMAAESHRVEWDGRSDSGESVASGVYFYRVNAGRFTETRKMVLMK
jgi:hypothetical protein